jgi:NAD-dependent dihydropyrimidine dehydrogenase PreA subunit
MKRQIIRIDEEKCIGCGSCASGCHQNALQIINGKAKLVREDYCDGLGMCIGDCPTGALTLTDAPEGEAKPTQIPADHHPKVVAHDLLSAKEEPLACGCPGSMARELKKESKPENQATLTDAPSELGNFPVQLHLANPAAPFFYEADLLLAADCTAFAAGNFHSKYLKGKKLVIGCPKLDANTERYIDKLVTLIDEAQINTLTLLIMEVPCCGGLGKIAEMAREKAQRNIPIRKIVIGMDGSKRFDTWI